MAPLNIAKRPKGGGANAESGDSQEPSSLRCNCQVVLNVSLIIVVCIMANYWTTELNISSKQLMEFLQGNKSDPELKLLLYNERQYSMQLQRELRLQADELTRLKLLLKDEQNVSTQLQLNLTLRHGEDARAERPPKDEWKTIVQNYEQFFGMFYKIIAFCYFCHALLFFFMAVCPQ